MDYMNIFQTIENILILSAVIYFYYEQILKVSVLNIFSQPQFWVVTAYFIYFAGTFFLILYISSLNHKEQGQYYVMNYIFTIIRTILLSIAMLIGYEDDYKKGKRNKFSNDLA